MPLPREHDIPYDSLEKALAAKKKNSVYYRSLNGVRISGVLTGISIAPPRSLSETASLVRMRSVNGFCNIFKKPLDNCDFLMYNGKAVKNAAIAQPVERILGKDEVASSNLASSSKTLNLLERCAAGVHFSSFL